MRPFVAECEEWVTDEYATEAVSRIPEEFSARLMDSTEFSEWVRANTSLEEVEHGKFLVHPESVNPMNGETVEAKYLVIE